MKNHQWISGDENDSMLGRTMSTMVQEGISFTAVVVPDSSMLTEQFFEIIELPNGVEVMVCIRESFINGIVEESKNEYACGYTLGIYVGSLLRDVHAQFLRGDNDE
jgi:hypothetical protein